MSVCRASTANLLRSSGLGICSELIGPLRLHRNGKSSPERPAPAKSSVSRCHPGRDPDGGLLFGVGSGQRQATSRLVAFVGCLTVLCLLSFSFSGACLGVGGVAELGTDVGSVRWAYHSCNVLLPANPCMASR